MSRFHVRAWALVSELNSDMIELCSAMMEEFVFPEGGMYGARLRSEEVVLLR